ncbi:MAG: T9SS type A sorting domain-containing protein [Bacteroidales bacterium]|nr:T9SS type A sorting domain-containing protein [Bacteroidales bacterium]
MKKLIILTFLSIFVFSNGNAQMSGTYSIGWGTGDSYQTLYLALEALQINGADGPVVFELSADYNPIPDAYPINISSFSGSSAINTLTIKLADGISDTIERDNSLAIFYIHDVSNVIIDGSNNGTDSRDLVISNLSTVDEHAAIFVENSSNIVIKNCILKANGNQYISSGVAAENNNNLLIENNEIKHAQIGAIVLGDSTFITGNTIGSTIPDEYLDFGVSCQFGEDVFVRDNIFFNFIDDDVYSNTNAIHAVAVNDLTGDVEITGNYIDSLIHTGTNNVVQAIAVLDCNTDNFLIANNRISNIASDSYETMPPGAIALSSPNLTSITIVHNSINMPENNEYGIGGSDNNVFAAGLLVNSGSGIIFKNNIISNTLGKRDGSSLITVGAAIAINFSTNPFDEIDNNVYFIDGDYLMTTLAMNTSGAMQLPDWQTFTGGETNSIFQEEVCFKSDDSLQLNSCSPAIARAEYLPEITTDIEGNQRNENYPSIGAYEYEIVQASDLNQIIPVKEIGYVLLGWNNGSGDRVAIFMKEGDYVANPPIAENGVTYLANNTFGDGDEIGSSGWFCVYNDYNTADYYSELYDINAIDGQTYTIMACDYFGSNENEIYLTDTANNNPIWVIANNGGAVNEINHELSFYPNPTDGKFTINTSASFGSETKTEEVIVYDFTGKQVMKITELTDNFIDISGLNSGVYLIEARSEDKIFSGKVVLR